jgi:hypothetical protein
MFYHADHVDCTSIVTISDCNDCVTANESGENGT